MPIDRTELETVIQNAFPDGIVECTDLAGDDDHWQVSICSRQFIGKSKIEQHKMVQKIVANHNIHALSIKTHTPQ
jgi:stress-induced morphogen